MSGVGYFEWVLLQVMSMEVQVQGMSDINRHAQGNLEFKTTDEDASNYEYEHK
jgi:hypothetical protein